jgi:peptidyl-prolyl cis-trans isomerase SurA
MSRLAQSIALLWAAAALLPFTPATAQDDGSAQALERIVAVVNDSVVLTSELEAEVARIRRRVREQGNDLPPQDVLRERALDNLIDERLQLARAQRRGISVDDAAVNEALRNMASERGTDLAGLRERAEQGDRSFEQIRTDVRHRLIISRLRQRAVAADIQLSAQEVDDFVARIERASDRQVQLRLRHILIELPDEPTPDELERARQQAQDVVARLRAGADFAALAQRVSGGSRALEGGDLGWRAQAELPSLFWDAVEDGEPGTITDPLRSGRGLHVLKLVDRRGGSAASVTEYQARHIVLPGDDDQARSRLATMRQRLRAGEADFAELARAESVHSETAQRDGRMGWIGPGDVPPAFLQALQGMQVGALSEPFRSPMGWHLVELTDQRERSDVEAYRRARARRTLYRRQVEQETQQWLRKLRENAFIERRLEP